MTDRIAAVDVGGTFTDIVVWDGSRLVTGKVPSTEDQSDGVVAGIATATHGAEGLRHGTTVATNALLERRGAETVLVTDAGFEDVVEIGRQARPSLYDTASVRSLPVAPRTHRIGLKGRADRSGHRMLADEEIEELVRRVDAIGPEAVAVSLLYSFADASAERTVAAAIARSTDAPVSISSEVAPEFREFERASTTLVNAYLSPEAGRYLRSLERRAPEAGVVGPITVMRSSGGLMAIEAAARLPAAILLSGPAGGVVAATALGLALGDRHLVSFDMGGTSTDVCRIDEGRPDVAYEREIDGLPVRMPSVAIHTVGAGGGSLGWRDPGGALRVGPRSAGASPGPASYGGGGIEPAVTDAHVLLGRLASGTRLGGGLVLDGVAAAGALERLGASLGLDPRATALGMIQVVESHMDRAIRRVSIEQGADPRRARLVAFGGAGGLHATALARRLDMAGVVIPPHAGVFSAVGLLLAPPRADAARSVLLIGGDTRALRAAVAEVAARASSSLEEGGVGAVEIRMFADVRYRGQSHEMAVCCDPDDDWEVVSARFHQAHRERNGFARPEDPIEVVTVRAEAEGRPAAHWSDLPVTAPSGEAGRGRRMVLVRGGEVAAGVWWRPALRPGERVSGPAVIEEPAATTFLGDGEVAAVHPSGALEVTW